jgi:hypothetical protein
MDTGDSTVTFPRRLDISVKYLAAADVTPGYTHFTPGHTQSSAYTALQTCETVLAAPRRLKFLCDLVKIPC